MKAGLISPSLVKMPTRLAFEDGRMLITEALLSALPLRLETRAQKLVEEVSGGVLKTAEVAPGTGASVFPGGPSYHWNSGSGRPVAAIVRVVLVPYWMLRAATGWRVMRGGMPVMVSVSVEFEPAPSLETMP